MGGHAPIERTVQSYYDEITERRETLPFPEGRFMFDGGDDDGIPTRDVFNLKVGELVRTSREHRRRTPVVIQGEALEETLRDRLLRESKELEVAVTALANQLARRTEQLERLKRFPEQDPFRDGTTLQFEKSFPHTPNNKYSYVAHRVNGLWYLTGERSPQGIAWDAFVSWMGLGVDAVYELPNNGTGRRRKVIG